MSNERNWKDWNELTKTQQKALKAIRDCKVVYNDHFSEYVSLKAAGVSGRTANELEKWNWIIVGRGYKWEARGGLLREGVEHLIPADEISAPTQEDFDLTAIDLAESELRLWCQKAGVPERVVNALSSAYQQALLEKTQEVAELKAAKLPAFKPGDRVTISPDSKIRAFRGDVGTVTGYFKVTYLIHWDETPEDMTSAIDETDLKGE